MSSDLLSIARSGAMAARIALDVTAQNIANASSTGYVRRSVSLTEVTASGGFGRVNDVVVYPATSRGLQQRMIQKEAELAVRFQHSCHFRHCLIHLINVLKHQTRNDCIKGLITGRNLRSAAKKITRPAAPFDCYINM